MVEITVQVEEDRYRAVTHLINREDTDIDTIEEVVNQGFGTAANRLSWDVLDNPFTGFVCLLELLDEPDKSIEKFKNRECTVSAFESDR